MMDFGNFVLHEKYFAHISLFMHIIIAWRSEVKLSILYT